MSPTLMAALEARLEELACYDRSCAPPPVGTGGSKPGNGSGSAPVDARGAYLPDGVDVRDQRRRKLSYIQDPESGTGELSGDMIQSAMGAVETLAEGFNNGTMTVRIRVGERILENHILADGYLKNQHESGDSNGAFDPEMRESIEAMMFSENIQRGPIYGYVHRGDGTDAGYVNGYGEVAIVLNKEAAMRATITIGDSLLDDPPAPMGIAELTAKISASDKAMALMAADSAWGMGTSASAQIVERNIGAIRRGEREIHTVYVESQIHGGVRLDRDVAKFVLPAYLQNSSLAEKLKYIAEVEFTYVYNDPVMTHYGADDEALIVFYDEMDFACYSKECAPPPVGTGGSKPGKGGGSGTPRIPEGINVQKRRNEIIETVLKPLIEENPQYEGWWYEWAEDQAKKLKDALETGELTVRTRVPIEVIDKIAADGRLKSQHESETSRGYFGPEVRSKAEETMFGVKGVNPIYGYIQKEGANAGYVGSYGPVSLVMKPEVLEQRTTLTLGDSLALKPAPIFINEIRELDTRDLANAVLAASYDFLQYPEYPASAKRLRPGQWVATSSYVEAQMLGTVSTKDISEIIVTTSATADKVRQAFPDIPIRIQSDVAWDEYSLEAEMTEDFACYDASCAPPPVGTGGSKPGPRKGRLSPTNEGRVRPDPLFKSAQKMIRHYGGEAQTREAMSKIFETELGNGISTTATKMSIGSEGVNISGHIWDSGKRIGFFSRSLLFEPDGTLYASHGMLKIDESHHGRGIAQKFNDHLLKAYDELGVDRIELEAALPTGPYAWARQGYRFDGNSYVGGGYDVEKQRQAWVKEAIGRARNVVRSNDSVSKEVKDQFIEEMNALLRASNAGEDVQPIHIASLGENRPELHQNGVWPGKAALIDRGEYDDLYRSWNGVYYLGRERSLTAALVS